MAEARSGQTLAPTDGATASGGTEAATRAVRWKREG
jgi:hypothetical protein